MPRPRPSRPSQRSPGCPSRPCRGCSTGGARWRRARGRGWRRRSSSTGTGAGHVRAWDRGKSISCSPSSAGSGRWRSSGEWSASPRSRACTSSSPRRGAPGNTGANWVDDLVERRPRGVVLVFSPDDAGGVLASRGRPFVVLDPLDEPRRDVVSIGSTNYGGGRMAAEHLLGLGHRRIATITGPPGDAQPGQAATPPG